MTSFVAVLRDKSDGNIEGLDGLVFGVLVGSIIEYIAVCSSTGAGVFRKKVVYE
jgi:hypothetical protein